MFKSLRVLDTMYLRVYLSRGLGIKEYLSKGPRIEGSTYLRVFVSNSIHLKDSKYLGVYVSESLPIKSLRI